MQQCSALLQYSYCYVTAKRKRNVKSPKVYFGHFTWMPLSNGLRCKQEAVLLNKRVVETVNISVHHF